MHACAPCACCERHRSSGGRKARAAHAHAAKPLPPRGTLADAVLRARQFHAPLVNDGGGAAANTVDVRGLLDVLLPVARALRHLHGVGLVHSDCKLDNVLLASDATAPQGFRPKARARARTGRGGLQVASTCLGRAPPAVRRGALAP